MSCSVWSCVSVVYEGFISSHSCIFQLCVTVSCVSCLPQLVKLQWLCVWQILGIHLSVHGLLSSLIALIYCSMCTRVHNNVCDPWSLRHRLVHIVCIVHVSEVYHIESYLTHTLINSTCTYTLLYADKCSVCRLILTDLWISAYVSKV